MKKLIILLLILIPGFVYSQWSSDPGKNLVLVRDSVNRISLNSNANLQWTENDRLYLSWYNSSEGNTSFLQLMEMDGSTNWTRTYVNISRFPYIHIDCSGNAVLSYSIKVNSVFVNLCFWEINQDGETEWGDYKVLLPQYDVPPYIYRHHVTISPDNEILTTFFNDHASSIAAMKILPDGNLAWPENQIVISPGSRSFIFYSDDGGFLLVRTKLFDFNYHGELLLMKYDRNGNPLWDKEEILFSGYIAIWTFSTYQDINGDIYIGFAPSKLIALSVEGSQLWQSGGIDVIYDTTAFFVAPKITGLNNSGELLVNFTRKNSYQKDPQQYGQLISPEGERLWTDKGQAFTEAGQYIEDIQWRLGNDNIYAIYQTGLKDRVDDSSKLAVNIFHYEDIPDWDQSFVLTQQRRFLNSFRVTDVNNDQIVVFWTEGDDGFPGALLAQNIHSDGSLGIKSNSNKKIPVWEAIFDGYNSEYQLLRFNVPSSKGNFALYNITGSIVTNGEIENEVALPGLPSGIYILSIQAGGKRESHKLFIR